MIRVLEQRRAPGETVDVHAIRGDRLLHHQLSLAPPQDNTCTLRMDTGADEAVAHRRLAWLGASVAQVSEAG